RNRWDYLQNDRLRDGTYKTPPSVAWGPPNPQSQFQNRPSPSRRHNSDLRYGSSDSLPCNEPLWDQNGPLPDYLSRRMTLSLRDARPWGMEAYPSLSLLRCRHVCSRLMLARESGPRMGAYPALRLTVAWLVLQQRRR